MRWVCGDGQCPACHPETFEQWLMVTYGALQCEGTKLHQVPIDHEIERKMYAERDAHVTQIAAEQAARVAEWNSPTGEPYDIFRRLKPFWSYESKTPLLDNKDTERQKDHSRALLDSVEKACHNGEGEDMAERFCDFRFCNVCNDGRAKRKRKGVSQC